MAIKANFFRNARRLSVFGDNADNTIVASRDAAGNILLNSGSISVAGGTPTVANTALIQVFGQGGNDTITLNEVNGVALPAAQLFGGAGDDTLTGGSGNDQLFGQETTFCSAAGDWISSTAAPVRTPSLTRSWPRQQPTVRVLPC